MEHPRARHVALRQRAVSLYQTTRQRIKQHQFLAALGLAVLVAFFLTSLSLEIYKITGAYLLDFSRPGLEKVRQSVDRAQTPTFDAIGPVTPETLDTFSQLYKKEKDALDKLGRFDSNTLDDSQLQLLGGTPDTPQ